MKFCTLAEVMVDEYFIVGAEDQILVDRDTWLARARWAKGPVSVPCD